MQATDPHGMASYFKKKVWAPDPENGFILGRVTDIGTDFITVEPAPSSLANKKKVQPIIAPYNCVFPAEEDEKKDVDDNCGLMYLNEATLLNNIRLRYQRDQIYTYVANILIAVNPYYEIPKLYDGSTIQKYQGKSLGTLPPHIFAIADKAYRDMKRSKESQSIIVSGESGAGKTETQKYILRYLCESWGSHAGPIQQRILETNPILEAFGNAKTTRNNNSSRFGKFIELHFNSKVQVAGGYVSHYLLEKSRICGQQREERNYHVFYQLCAGAPKELREQLRLTNPDAFTYLKYGCTQYFCNAENAKQLAIGQKSKTLQQHGPLMDSVIDDVADFRRLDAALSNIGLSDPKQRFYIYATVASVLYLGNVDFCEAADDTRGGCIIDPKTQSDLLMAAGLLGVEKDELDMGLTSRVTQTNKGGIKGTVIRVPLKVYEAHNARDALAKAIYSRLFDYIVKKINECIPFSSSDSYIGVLDIAGFEFFTMNSFEQFCINYCNEKLQQFFNERILRQEQELYDKEGLGIRKINYIDNSDCVELIEGRGNGILDVLDEENKLPKPSSMHFTETLHSVHKNHFRLAIPRKSKLKEHRDLRDDEGFLIRHYAGAVCYHTALFIDKNNDALHASLEFLIHESKSPFLRHLFHTVAIENGDIGQSKNSKVGKLAFISVGSKFRSQLKVLMEKLERTGTHFIRCIKPNSSMVAHKFEGAAILSQLQCSGMGSVLELMQQGFPSRTQFAELYKMYKDFMPSDLSRLDPRLFCKCLFKALGLDEHDFKFGLTKVFFRPGKFAEFDQMLRSDPENLRQLVAKVKTWLIIMRWKKAQWCALSVIKLKNKILWRRQKLVLLQSWFRSLAAQKRYKPKILGIRKVKTLYRHVTAIKDVTKSLVKDHDAWMRRIRDLEESVNRLVVRIRDTPMTSQEIDREYGKLQATIEATLTELRNQAAVQAAEQERLRKAQEEMEIQKRKKEMEEAKQREQEAAHQERMEMEQRRREAEEANQQQLVLNAALLARQAEVKKEEEKQREKQLEQEKRDSELARRIAQEINGTMEESIPQQAPKNNTKTKYDLSKWSYAELRDVINTSNDIELLESCRDEFHRRLRVYHDWKTRNAKGKPELIEQRAPDSVVQNAQMSALINHHHAPVMNGTNTQRYFRVPFARSSEKYRDGNENKKTGYWYAHFDGQWIARQMEVHPDKVPILLVAGRDDLQMCELNLEQTGLTQKRGAEIVAHEFDVEWKKFGGPPYIGRH